MEQFILCKKCGCELEFTEMPVEFKHKWKSECTQCVSKYGNPLFSGWVAQKTMNNIIRNFPHIKVHHRAPSADAA